MRRSIFATRDWVRSAVLLGTIFVTGAALAAWKSAAGRAANAAAASQPEPIESVTLAVARERQYRPTTTSVGTVLALSSITLRNELAGTVREVTLTPGQVVEAGTVLVALDVSVEQVDVFAADDPRPLAARIVAVDAKIDPTTRNAMVRARISSRAPAPGASVRVEVPVGPATKVVAIPVSALRKGPAGDQVFVIL